MNIAIIGLGEVGQCYAQALHQAGHSLQLAAPRPSSAATQIAAGMGLSISANLADALSGSDWIFSCVTGAQALPVVQNIVRHAATGSTVCDFTTASMDTKRQAAALCAASGMRYVDVAIMGAIALGREKTPLLTAGEGAQALADALQGVGSRVTVMAGAAAGDTIALKLLRSQFTKGLEALSVEVCMAAEQQGLREALFEQLQDVDHTPLQTFVDMLVSTHVLHARRRAEEVHAVALSLQQAGLPSLVLPGVEQRFRRTADALATQPPPQSAPTAQEALHWLLQNEAGNRSA
ncbi:NAD(P)-binding domain-containing protein [Rhodoferax sp. GW822-FHT02A01]|uniref:NAD(P)-dependent oxidoreductase n=1 Tax=Rhodoferax sp. GW822-FHT02A01 TaxID=3141537 RepID=UPI00315D2F2F